MNKLFEWTADSGKSGTGGDGQAERVEFHESYRRRQDFSDGGRRDPNVFAQVWWRGLKECMWRHLAEAEEKDNPNLLGLVLD